jgi:hypothetical protein
MKRPLAALLLGAVVLAGTGCSMTNVEPDEAGLVYDAGPFSSTTFQECLPPSTRDISGPSDEGYTYPNGQRTYDFGGQAGSEGKPITSTTKDGQTMTMRGGLTFYFNADDCDKLKAFHQNIGRKYKAYEDDGWARMLSFYIGNPVERAMDEATLKYDWRQLYRDSAKKALWEADMARLAGQYIKTVAQGDYFERIQFIIRQPEPPAELVAAMTATQTATERQKAQEAENTRTLTELESLEKLAKVLGPLGAILYKAIQDGKVTVVPVPAGGNLHSTPQGR